MMSRISTTSGPGIRSLLRLASFLLVMAFACPVLAASPDVVISQVYGGGGNTGATYKNDFIELHNNGASAVSLNGWSVQYASATGTTWQVTNLTNVTLQPGQYYLVQEAAGASATAINLPTPDATGTIAMGGTAGKVALVTNQTALTAVCGGTCASNAVVRDYVGFGTTATNFEGSGPTPAPSNTTAVLRAGNGCSDTDVNSADFAAGAANPRNTATTLAACSVPVVNGACGGDNGQTLSATPANLCSAGTASAVSGSGPWSWSCSGSNGGTTVNCSALLSSVVNGACGTASGQLATSAPTANLCSLGTATAVTGSGPWTWQCTSSTGGSSANCATAGTISIFHVNDTHARLTPHKMSAPLHGTGSPLFEDVGGAAHMAGKMLELTTATPDSLVIDAGDISEGSPIGDMTFAGCATGGTPGMSSNCGMTKFYELLSNKLKTVPGRNGRGMDAVVVGNHDVRDASYIGNLDALRASGVAVISANVRDIATGLPHFAPYTIVNVAGKKVGIIGYTTESAEVGASLAGTLQVVNCDWNTATAPCNIKTYVDELRGAPNNVDIVVLGAHIGHSGMVDPNPALYAKLLVDDGVTKLPEVSVNGHWHSWAETPAWQPESLNYKTTITESGSYLTYIGELKIDDTGKYLSGYNHLLRNSDITPDPDVKAFVDNLVTLYDANAVATGKPRAFDVVGYTNDNLLLDNEMRWWSPNEYPWSGNNPAGQWICDAMQWKAAQLFGSCDLAIETGGGVRADIPAGPVTYLQVYETFPWSDDTYVRINMTGQDIVNFLKNTNMNAGFSRRLHVTSVDGVPTTILFDGAPINLGQVYTVAINNYMYAHPPAGYTWLDTAPLTNPGLVRDSLVEFMQTNHATPTAAYSVGGPRYVLNTEFSGGFRAVVTMLNDNDTRPTFEDAFIRFLSATPETLARRGQGKVPADLVNADGTINQNHHLAEAEWYRSYLGFKAGALKNGDIVEVWGKGSFFDGNPEFVEQEGIYGNGIEFKILGNDPSLAKPAFKSSIGEFLNDHHKNHYVQFQAKKTATSTVQDQFGQTITISDRTAFANYTLPGAVNDILLITGVPTMENFGFRFRCDSAVVSGALPTASSVSSRVNPLQPATAAASINLAATASSTSGIYYLSPSADGQVASGNPTTNYGASTNIYIQSDNSGFGNERGWLKFDLASIPAGSIINSATLQLWNWKSTGASLPVEVRSASDDTWTETGINWSTQPALGAVLDTQTLTSGTTNVWYNWNVTSFVQSEFAGDKTASLLLKPVTENSADATAPSYGFDSKEFASNKPVLQISTGVVAATITQVQYYYRYSANGTSWGGWSTTGSPVTTAPYALSFAFPAGQGYYEFYSVATDSTGAVQPTPAGAQSATRYTASPAYLPAVSIDNLYQKYDGSAKTVSLITLPVTVDSSSVTYNGSATAPTAPGVYTVVATAASGGISSSITGSLVIGKGAATVALGNLNVTYDGSAKNATATTTPSGLATTMTYDGSATSPVAVGSYSVVATINDANYFGTATGSMTIAKGTATVTLGSLNATFDGTAKSVAATTTPAGLTVTVTYNGSATAPSAAGTYLVEATISDANYAGTANGILTINKAPATVVLNITNNDTATAAAAATTNPAGLAVIITYNGSTTVPTATGTYSVVATINDPDFQGSASGTMIIAAGSGATPVPALGLWGIMLAIAGLAGIMFRKRTAC
jgi:2',3'-cyclic-nucleotide 2'-phosphodiesterase (5'-nucleotidase family)